MPRSSHGGRHELGQNFLVHRSTIQHFAALVANTSGPILEIGAGNGALTRVFAKLDRQVTAIDIDEHRVTQLRRSIQDVQVEHGDALQYSLNFPVIVGNIPFHLTTPILRRLLSTTSWEQAILLTQWEVARKRAGVGGSTMMTAQAAPWFTFELHGRVPSHGFNPRPNVDGGILGIHRRRSALVPDRERKAYERFVRAVFSGRGGTLTRIVQNATPLSAREANRALSQAGVRRNSLPRDLSDMNWSRLWRAIRH